MVHARLRPAAHRGAGPGAQRAAGALRAQRAGLSRTSVYEYFASSADLAADLVIEELESFAETLAGAANETTDPLEAIEFWIKGSLIYIADGRHLLAKALNAIDLPRERSAAIGSAHRALLAPLRSRLAELGVRDIDMALSLIQSITDNASRRIERGNDAEGVITSVTTFCIAGINSLRR